MNKVLNRPMFRQKALKKGHLKPIHAQTGIMVGSPITSAPVPAIRKAPTFMERMSVSGPARFFKTGVSIPTVGGYMLGEKVAEGFGVDDPVGKTAFGLGGSYLATKAMPALAGLPASLSLALMAGPAYLGYAGKKEYDRIQKMSPKERASHMAKAKQFGLEGYLDDETFEQQFKPGLDKIVKKEKKKEEVKMSKNAKPGSGRIGFGNRDRLTQEENKSKVVQGDVDISKVVANNADPNLSAPLVGTQQTTIQDNMPPKKNTQLAKKGDNDEVKTEKDATKDLITNQVNNTKKGKVKAADGTSVTNETIALAKQYRKELMAGQKSQAKLVFLANLASGLLTGKTAQGGIGGALEVFGAALGPAVNNYATIKLKENELENDFMSDALELARDEIDARNGVLEAPDFPDAQPGIIQITDDRGTKNVTARRLKDGTVQYAVYGQKDQYGRQLFITAPYGSYDKFLQADFAAKEQTETLHDLSSKYKAYSLGRDSINILRKEDVVGGPKGRLSIFTKRLGDAMNDFGMGFFGQEDGMAKIAEMRDDVKQGLIAGGKTEEEAEKYLNDKFGKGNSLFKKTLEEMGVFKDTGADLERLAINETILKDIERLEFDYTNAYLGDSITISNYRRRYNITGAGGQAIEGDLPGFFDGMSTEDVLGNIQIQ